MLYIVKKDGAVRINPPTLSHQIVFWAGKVPCRAVSDSLLHVFRGF